MDARLTRFQAKGRSRIAIGSWLRPRIVREIILMSQPLRAQVHIRPARPDDIGHITDEPLPWRIRALTGEIDGRVIGVGGLTWLPGGTIAAFAALTDEARRYKVSLHRAGLRLMREAKEVGIRSIVASADTQSVTAMRWLLRLGFEPIESDHDRTMFIWHAHHDAKDMQKENALR